MHALVGDIGGTNARLRLVDLGGTGPAVAEHTWTTSDHPAFENVVEAAIEEFSAQDVSICCLAVAGPVIEGRVELTNASWAIDAGSLRARFGFQDIEVVNDFRAVGESISALGTEDLLTINDASRDPRSPAAVLGAGTGLGEAIVVYDDDRAVIVETEGGHCDFGPNDEDQTELLGFLRKRYGHVSWERILSGDGIVDVARFFSARETGRSRESRFGTAVDVARGWERGDPIARDAIGLFVDVFGGEAGNLALKCLPRAGVFLAGGIAAKNPQWFSDGRFMAAFTAKGRFADLMRQFPVFLITNESAGLIGATEIARRLAARTGETSR